MSKAVVIGAGAAGLATAALLAKDGYEVTIFEKNKKIGGRGRVWKKSGYKFDMGPSWYMMPEVFEGFLRIFNKKIKDYYQLIRLPIHYRVFFDQGRIYDIKTKINDNLKLFERTEKGAGGKLKTYLDKSKDIYLKAMKELIMLDYDNWSQLFKLSLLSQLFKIKLWGNFHNEVEKFFKNKDLQKILEFTTVFLGGSPYNTPSFYTLMSHTDMGLGLWYPMGGMNQIFKMLKKVGQEYGVKIKTGVEVDRIVVLEGTALGVEINNKLIPADLVISGADYYHTETKLLEKKWQSYSDDYWKKVTLSPSAFILYLGIKGKTEKLSHHNLYFSDDWEKGFKEVYKSGLWPDCPSYYVHVPSVSDESVCPVNGETIMILVPVAPFLKDTDKVRDRFGKKVIDHLEKITGEKIKDRIVVKKIFSHRDFVQDYHALGGAAFGLAHTLGQSAIFRPKNRSRKVKNLFFVGQNTNPGVGVPIGILSAMVTRKLINRLTNK